MLYRYETHCHANFCSKCAHSTPAEMVRAYKDAGYAGLILTDHFIHGYTCVDQSLPWAQRMACYWGAYLQAKAEGDSLDFDVIFGIEHAYGGGQEVLVYGIGLDFLLEHPEIETASLEEFAALVHAVGGILIQAHPYRYGGWEVPVLLDLVDGIEVYNAGNEPLKNRMALQKAQEKPCILTAGADSHAAWEERVGTTGIALPYRVSDGQALVEALRKGDHKLVIRGQITDTITPEVL